MKMRVVRHADLCRAALCFILPLFFAITAAAQSKAIALVADNLGQSTITTDGVSSPVQLLSEIYPGTQAQLQRGAKLVVLYLDDGVEFTFAGPSSIEFRSGQPKVNFGAPPIVRSPSTTIRVRLKPIGLGQGALVLRSTTKVPQIKLLTANDTRVLEARPKFRWQGPEPGVKYRVNISDDAGRTIFDGQVSADGFELPDGLQLGADQKYMWEVSARLSDGRKHSSIGFFRVASEELRTDAVSLLADTTSEVSSRVTYAMWLEQMELKDEARKVWQGLLVDRPNELRLKSLVD